MSAYNLIGGGGATHREAGRWFLEMESTHGEDTVKTVERAAKGLDHNINLVGKAEVGRERPDSSFDGTATVIKMLPIRSAGYREIICERGVSVANSSLSYFKKFSQPLQPSASTTLISQLSSTLR